jgi:putative ATP-dependent endonuclease of OLD family
MHISSLVVRNYRNFRNAKLHFKNGINTIIGENGSGKTNLFYALRLLIDSNLPRYTRFYSSDFNRSLTSWAGQWIIISIEFDDLDPSEESQALALHSTGNMDSTSKGSYSLYFRPKYEFRKKLFEYSGNVKKNQKGLNDLLNEITLDDYETFFLGRGTGDFSDDKIYSKYVGDFDSIKFPDPDDKQDDIFGVWLPKEINIHNELSCTFIKALRDVEADLKSYGSNPLVNLLRGKEKTVEIQKQSEIIESIDKLNEQLGSLDEVVEIKKGIDKSIKEAIGTTYAPNIDIKSELPNEMEKLFQSLKLWVGDPDEEGYKGRIWELSLGGANIIYLSLKLLEYEKLMHDKIANFLLIEEPESHIHTHIQKTLFNNLKGSSTQVIISTHSTHISSVSKISSLNILSRGNKEAVVFAPSNKLTSAQIVSLERYLDAVRSNLLFAKGVVLVEGDAEQILIPQMFKSAFNLTLDEIGVSLVNIGSTGFENIACIFNKDRIKKNCAILTDSDKSITVLEENEEEDDAFQKHCRASERKGEERKVRLNEYCAGNSYLRPFYAKYTFEVDFLLNGNTFEVEHCINKIFNTVAKRTASIGKIKNEDVSISGREILRIAENYGKGWFALLLADQLVYNTFIPSYILKAIAFSSSHINSASIHKALFYRLKRIADHTDIDDHKLAIRTLKKIEGREAEKALEIFKQDFPDDQLVKFISHL